MVLRLCDAGEDVVVFDNLSTGHKSLVSPDAVFVEGSLDDLAAVTACIRDHKVTEILHFAGSIIVPESVANPLKYYENNTSVSRGLIEVAVAEGVERFIFSSTAAVYGAVGADPVAEGASTVPLSPYGTSKLMTEWMLRDVAEVKPLRYGIFRYFNVAGADPAGRSGHSSGDATHLIKVACKAALGQRDHVAVFGGDFDTVDGSGVRDYIHVSDLVDAHALLLNYLREGGDSVTMNCGYGIGSSVRQVIEMVKDISGVDFAVKEAPRRAGDPASVVADVRKLRTNLPWVPKHNDLREMVKSAYDWELKLAEKGGP
jgi:UDP-glucose 4-epimerase